MTRPVLPPVPSEKKLYFGVLPGYATQNPTYRSNKILPASPGEKYYFWGKWEATFPIFPKKENPPPSAEEPQITYGPLLLSTLDHSGRPWPGIPVFPGAAGGRGGSDPPGRSRSLSQRVAGVESLAARLAGGGWTTSLWRLALVNATLFLLVLPAAAVSLACIGLALGGAAGAIFSNQPVPLERMVVAVIVAAVLLTILSIPATALGAYTRLAQRAVVLDGLGVRAALLCGVQIVRGCFREVFILWLVLTTFQLLYALVALPLVSFLAVTGMALAWIIGAGVYFVIQSLMEAQVAFIIAALLGGLVFVLVLYLPMWLVDGLAATYVSVSWTRAYRQMAAGLSGPGVGASPKRNLHAD